MRTSLRFHILQLAAAATLVSSAGCNLLLGVEDLTQSEPDAAPEPDASSTTARVRVLHVVRGLPSGGLVDVYVDDETTPRLPALSGLSDYFTVTSASTKISIRAQGQSGGEPLFEFDNLVFEGGTDTTAVLTGLATSLTGDEAVRLIPVVDGYAQAGTGMTQVRFLNAIVDLPSVGIDLDFYGEGSPEVSGLARFASSPAAGVGRASDQVLRFGIVSNGVTVAGFSSQTLPVGVGCLVVLSGKLAEPRDERDSLGATLACRTSIATLASRAEQFSVVHFLGDVQPPATATLLETPASRTINPNVGLRALSSFWIAAADEFGISMQFPSRTIDLGVTPDFADAGRAVFVVGGTLQPGSGENDGTVRMLVFAAAPTSGPRVIRFINMTADLGTVELVDQGSNTLAGNAGFGSWSEEAMLTAGTHQLTVRVGASPVATFPFTTSGAGGSTLLVLDGAETPTSGQRAVRLTPIDLSTTPPTVGSPIAPN